MTVAESDNASSFDARTKLFVLIILLLLLVAFLLQIRQILSPFLWALVAAYLLGPIVKYLSVDGGLPRLWSVFLIYASLGLLVAAGSNYLYPRVEEQVNVFLEDLPRLEASLVALVGPRPLGIDIAAVISDSVSSVSGGMSTRSAGHLIVNAFETIVKMFLFLVATFYLLMDGPRLRSSIADSLPPQYRPELIALGRQINATWQQYIRGELVLFVIMTTVSSIGLTILQVPGALFIGIATGILELLPLVGPWTAGALAVSVAYFSNTNPFGWGQLAYAGVVAVMYFVLRQAEDYFVAPHILGRAVRLHPLIVLFALTAGGIVGGLLGLIVAVPIAASVKAVLRYLYFKMLDQPVQFEPVRTLGGGIIEIPIEVEREPEPEDDLAERPGATRQVDAV